MLKWELYNGTHHQNPHGINTYLDTNIIELHVGGTQGTIVFWRLVLFKIKELFNSK